MTTIEELLTAKGERTPMRQPWPKRCFAVIPAVIILSGLVHVATGEDTERENLSLSNPFFAFDNGTGHGQLAPEKQAQMLADLGYDGIGYTGTAGIPQMLDALDKHNLKMFSIYVGAVLGPDGPSCDPGLQQAVRALKGRGTIIWLTIRGQAADADQQAIRVAREVADLAGQSGLRVALYPHYGFYVDRVETAVHVAEKADRDNLGASFNLCHFLRVGDAKNLDQRLRQAMPHMMLVSINGSDHEGNWDRLIQTLDRGDYDVFGILTRLRQFGYEGPVGLQCYQVPGDRRENLKRSIDAWNGFVKRMGDE